MKPNYKDLGYANRMGKELKALVEENLKNDLKNYKVNENQLKFDWSESCIEGRRTEYLDGAVENFSGISVFDEEDNLVAEGWMDFVHEPNFFIAYWDRVTTWDKNSKKATKDFGMPKHI